MAKRTHVPISRSTKGKDRNFLSVKEGAGMTAKGRAAYNRKNGSNLKAPAPNPKTKEDEGRRKSFCARSRGWTGERGKAARKRWNC
jgi:hypothetical protein